MAKSRPPRAPSPQVRKKPHPGDLIRVIRGLVRRQRVTYTRHTLDERMPERGFDIDDVQYILTRGMIEGDIRPGRKPGDWECLVVSKLELGGRDAGVAVVVVRRDRLIIKTVEWKDP
jgi:hypothetical protein